jgi:hypothetical protein
MVHGIGSGVQRRRRHRHADVDQRRVLLDDSDPASWRLAVGLDWRQSGVFWGVFISETSVGLFTLWLFTRERWKTAQV